MKKLLKKIAPGFLIRAVHYFEHRYYRYHAETVSLAKELSKETGISYLAMLLDINLSVLKLVTPGEYKTYRFYDKSHRARDQILTRYRVIKLDGAFNYQDPSLAPADQLRFVRKQLHYKLLSDFLGRQWLYAPDATDQQIEEFLKTHKQIIVKPHDDGRGVGVRKILCSEIVDVRAFCESARKDGLMLEEIVEQHPDLSAINPTSVNTVRIHTVIDKTGVPHILCAGLRMGIGKSITDNLDGSGIAAQVDLESGVIFTPAIGKDLQTYIKHPTSGVVLPGFQIPHWEAVKEMVLHLAKISFQTRWIGWDIAITEHKPLLIEGNTDLGVKLTQLPTQTGIYHVLRGYL